MPERPTAAFVLSLIAAIFILLNGLVVVALGALLFAFFPGLGMVLAAVGMIFGIIVLIGAIMLYARPEQHTAWGVVVLLFSIFSLVIGGGFVLGFILGLVGGILGIVFKPTPPMPMMAPYAPPPMAPPPQ